MDISSNVLITYQYSYNGESKIGTAISKLDVGIWYYSKLEGIKQGATLVILNTVTLSKNEFIIKYIENSNKTTQIL